MMQIMDSGRIIVNICPDCKRAKKVQLTVSKKGDSWEYYQYFPVES